MKLKVLVADDHSIVRMGLVALLESDLELQVVGEAGDGKEAVSMSRKLRPDVIIMDLAMPVMDGIEATAAIVAAEPDAKVLLLTSFGTSDAISRAMKAGVRGALMKNSPNAELLDTVKRVAAGEIVVSPDVEALMREDPPAPELTDRQKEILRSATLGFTNRDIAAQFGISPTVVKQHLNAVFMKLGAANRAEAITIALRKQLLKL